jgi:hypothetical protein
MGAQQGPTPTLNSLLQSQPSPQQSAPPQQQGTPHRYPNPGPYDPNPYGPPGNGPPPIPPNSGSSSPMPTPTQSQQQQQMQQQGWAPPPRPYSPQQYRGPPPVSRLSFYYCQIHVFCMKLELNECMNNNRVTVKNYDREKKIFFLLFANRQNVPNKNNLKGETIKFNLLLLCPDASTAV